MRVHLIAIGGSVMHNLAITLKNKGYLVTGSDDEIFEPSKTRLKNKELLPDQDGWFPEKITPEIDAIILGMHARKDNPELLKAQQLGLRIYSYPEYIFEQTKDKTRVVVGGSHGKTTITSMILHVLKSCNIEADYLVGAKIEGFDSMVNLSKSSKIAVFEGDEYLASPLDLRPKFHLYEPHYAIISGIAWDHINVFPKFELYVEQFRIFIEKINKNGALVYYEGDEVLQGLVKSNKDTFEKIPYSTPVHEIRDGKTFLKYEDQFIPLKIFGKHNLQNLEGARIICNKIGVNNSDFFRAIASFSGAAKRLELVKEMDEFVFYKDFAHSPSKLQATIDAVKNQYPDREVIACMELHTFSSLNANFLLEYKHTMNQADKALVYYNPHTVEHKRLEMISKEQIKNAFGRNDLEVYTESKEVSDYIKSIKWKNKVLLMMSSGTFDGIDFNELANNLK